MIVTPAKCSFGEFVFDFSLGFGSFLSINSKRGMYVCVSYKYMVILNVNKETKQTNR